MFVLKSTHDFQLDMANHKRLDLLQTIRKLEKQIEDLKADHDEELNNLLIQTEQCSVCIDWKGMNVVSIERMVNENDCDQTTIGYMNPETNYVSEWYLQCDVHTHEQLVEEFREYLSSRE